MVELEQRFAENTSMHGIGNAARSANLPQRIFWILVVLTGMGLCTWQITSRLITFFEYNVNTEITLKYETRLAFPALTLCNFNRYFDSKVSEEDEQYISYLLYSNSDDYYDDDYSSQFGSQFSYFDFNLTDFSLSNFTQKSGFELDSTTLLDCKWRGKSCTSDNFTHVFTTYGNCYTFNIDETQVLYQNQPGAGNGLRVLIDIKQEDYMEPFVGGNLEAGIKFLVHNQNEPANMDSSGQGAPPGFHTFGSIQMLRSINLDDPWGEDGCEDGNPLQYYEDYSLSACLEECKLQVILEHCGCRPVRFPGNSIECTVYQQATCVKSELLKYKQGVYGTCSCDVPCNFTSFRTSVSYAEIPNYSAAVEFRQIYNLTESYISDNIVLLNVYFEDLNFQQYKQGKAMTESALISDVGGQLGLFIGASVVTLFEVVEYFTQKIYSLNRKGKNNMAKNTIFTLEKKTTKT